VVRDEILGFAQNDKVGALGAGEEGVKSGRLILRYAQDDRRNTAPIKKAGRFHEPASANPITFHVSRFSPT
jgi:hypothetical protein